MSLQQEVAFQSALKTISIPGMGEVPTSVLKSKTYKGNWKKKTKKIFIQIFKITKANNMIYIFFYFTSYPK